MAERENLPSGFARFTLSASEQIALVQIIDKISRDKTMTELWQYRLAGGYAQLFEHDRASGTYDLHL
jgi:hypothetical protein